MNDFLFNIAPNTTVWFKAREREFQAVEAGEISGKMAKFCHRRKSKLHVVAFTSHPL